MIPIDVGGCVTRAAHVVTLVCSFRREFQQGQPEIVVGLSPVGVFPNCVDDACFLIQQTEVHMNTTLNYI
jgi:hypothetical protein